MWVKIDDAITDHPKLLSCQYPSLTLALQVAALCYCNRNRTDGFIPKGKAAFLLPLEDNIGFLNGMHGEDASWAPIIEDAVVFGLWEEVDGGYEIHDYLEYQPSAESQAAKDILLSKKRSDAGKKGAAIRWQNGKPIANGCQEAWQTDSPVPETRRSKDKPLSPSERPKGVHPGALGKFEEKVGRLATDTELRSLRALCKHYPDDVCCIAISQAYMQINEGSSHPRNVFAFITQIAKGESS